METFTDQINEAHTLYAIEMRMTRDEEITIGKLGSFSFHQGTYVYVGSAKRNIRSRISRHVTREKKHRWHLDYLRPYVDIVGIQTYPGKEGECQLFQRLMKDHQASVPVKGFGSSDCKCVSHLFYYSFE
jgi:Uri superfamily endonuclease